MRIVLTGGGTGGHLVPLVSVAKKIKEKVPDCEFLFVGPNGKMEQEIMTKAGIPIKGVMVGKMRRYFSLENVIDFFKVPIGIIQALAILLINMPDAIFSKGGYASIPVVLAGWAYRIPILIHESDANPGLANSMLSKFANRVAVTYPEAERYFPAPQVVATGNPVRDDIVLGDGQKAKEQFNLSSDKKVILILGGSLGARNINNRILAILPELLKKYQIIHQTGEANYEEVRRKAGELGIKPGRDGYSIIAFYGDEIKDMLAAADLIISRAGANNISEIAAVGKPTIFVPLSSAANDHQRMNAYALAKIGACVVLEENNLGEHMFLTKIDEMMDNVELREKMIQGIKSFYRPDATERIAEGILAMIN